MSSTPAGAAPARTPTPVVFDFDGTIVDTEWPIYLGARAAVATYGVDLSVEDWSVAVGVSDGPGGWFDQLCERLGIPIPRDGFDAAYEASRATRPSAHEAEPQPGAVELVRALAEAGHPLAIASGSPVGWIDLHLTRLGIRDCFSSLAGVDRVGGRGKPAPDTYLLACRELGTEPRRAVAIEDSPPGVAAARTAGLRCIAVPSAITRHTDVSAADLVVGGLAEVTPAVIDALASR